VSDCANPAPATRPVSLDFRVYVHVTDYVFRLISSLAESTRRQQDDGERTFGASGLDLADTSEKTLGRRLARKKSWKMIPAA